MNHENYGASIKDCMPDILRNAHIRPGDVLLKGDTKTLIGQLPHVLRAQSASLAHVKVNIEICMCICMRIYICVYINLSSHTMILRQ